MNPTAQQLPSNPALDFADAILEETNNALELIEILHDIAQGNDEDATPNDRITATNILMERGLGKCPKQAPATGSARNPAPETDDTDVEAIRESPHTVPHKEPESPRLVTQIKDSLNQSLGPAPSAQPPTRHSGAPTRHSHESMSCTPIREGNPQSPDIPDSPETSEPFNPSSIQSLIQKHILTITNNGQTLRDTLEEIARAKDDPKVKTYHRCRAVRILLDRILGTALALPRSAPQSEPAQEKPYRRPVRYVDPVLLAEARAEIQRMKDEGILTPDPSRPKIDISKYRMPKDFDPTPYAKEEAAKFWAEIDLRLERQKNWPKIEERRRKKLEQIYPSHSEDESDDPPET